MGRIGEEGDSLNRANFERMTAENGALQAVPIFPIFPSQAEILGPRLARAEDDT